MDIYRVLSFLVDQVLNEKSPTPSAPTMSEIAQVVCSRADMPKEVIKMIIVKLMKREKQVTAHCLELLDFLTQTCDSSLYTQFSQKDFLIRISAIIKSNEFGPIVVQRTIKLLRCWRDLMNKETHPLFFQFFENAVKQGIQIPNEYKSPYLNSKIAALSTQNKRVDSKQQIQSQKVKLNAQAESTLKNIQLINDLIDTVDHRANVDQNQQLNHLISTVKKQEGNLISLIEQLTLSNEEALLKLYLVLNDDIQATFIRFQALKRNEKPLPFKGKLLEDLENKEDKDPNIAATTSSTSAAVASAQSKASKASLASPTSNHTVAAATQPSSASQKPNSQSASPAQTSDQTIKQKANTEMPQTKASDQQNAAQNTKPKEQQTPPPSKKVIDLLADDFNGTPTPTRSTQISQPDALKNAYNIANQSRQPSLSVNSLSIPMNPFENSQQLSASALPGIQIQQQPQHQQHMHQAFFDMSQQSGMGVYAQPMHMGQQQQQSQNQGYFFNSYSTTGQQQQQQSQQQQIQYSNVFPSQSIGFSTQYQGFQTTNPNFEFKIEGNTNQIGFTTSATSGGFVEQPKKKDNAFDDLDDMFGIGSNQPSK